MNRLAQGLIAGSIIAAVTGLFMRRNVRRASTLNRFYNMMINMMGRIGAFNLVGRSRFFRKLVNLR